MNYSTFLVDLTRILEGDEVSPTDLPLNTLQQIIGLAERQIYRDVRCRWNQKSFADAIVDGTTMQLVVTDNEAPIPDDLEATDFVHFGKKALLPVAHEWLIEYLQNAGTGDCQYFATTGASFKFGPAVADDTEVQGNYFARLPALTAGTAASNKLFQLENDVFLYACLVEAAPIFKRMADLPGWAAVYGATVDRVNKRTSDAAYSAGRMRIKPSTRVIR